MMEFVTTAPKEPACCPSLKVHNTYRLENGKLLEIATKTLGRLSVTDLEGTNWTLTHLARTERVPQDIDVTAVFQANKVSGSSGCNRYFADVSENDPSQLKIGKTGSTRMACPPPMMQVENRYLTALGKVKRFGFMLGQLALTYVDDTKSDTLLFSADKGRSCVEADSIR